MADFTQDILYNLICNVGAFAEGIDRGISDLDRMEHGFERLERGMSILNRSLSVFLGNLASDVFRGAVRGLNRMVDAVTKTEEIGSRLENLGLILKRGIGGPFWDSLLKIAAGTLDKLTSLFRDAEGRWTEPFLRLRAVAATIGNWLVSLWQRLVHQLDEASQSWLDRLVSGIVAAIQKAATLLRRFATFVARIFGGRAPAEVTEAAIARTRAAPMARPEAVRPLVGEEEIKPERAPRAITPVAPPSAEDIKQVGILTGEWAAMTRKLAQATAAATKARERLAKAEEWLEKASEKVYNIRRKIARLELQWAEIPERFIRGRRRQLQLELMAAEHEEHERKKETDAAQERFRAAEDYRREVEQVTEALKRQIDSLVASIERQAERYDAYLQKLREAGQEQEGVITKTWDAFAGLDDLTAGYIEEIEGELLPAFADIELSVQSIVGSLGKAWEKVKGIAADVWGFLTDVKNWFDGLPEWAQKLLKTGALAIALNWVTGGMAGAALKTALSLAFAAIGLGPTAWAIVAAGISISLLLVPALTPEVQEAWKKAWEVFKGGEDVGKAIGEAAGLTLENVPIIGQILKNWADEFREANPELIKTARESLALPLIEALQDAYDALFGGSIVPEIVTELIDWFDRAEIDLSPIIDRLQGKLQILEKSFAGLVPTLQDFGFASGGSFKVVTVNLQGSTWGAGVSEWEVKDWIYEAIGGIV